MKRKDTTEWYNQNKLVAGLLGICLGTMGIHKFYLGRIGWGIIYILFSWTGIPSIVGFIEGVLYLCMSDKDFRKKYFSNPGK